MRNNNKETDPIHMIIMIVAFMIIGGLVYASNHMTEVAWQEHERFYQEYGKQPSGFGKEFQELNWHLKFKEVPEESW